MGVPYSYQSIMHYGPFDFAIDPNQPTLKGINGVVGEQSDTLSDDDVTLIRLFYNCLE